MKTVYFFGNKHPINESLVNNPPSGFQIKTNLSEGSFNIVGEYTPQYEFLKGMIDRSFRWLELPRMIFIPNNCDLIHTQGGVIPLNKRPHVITIEHSSSFFSLDDDRFFQERSKKILLRFLERNECKSILSYSEATKKSLIHALGQDSEKVMNKIEVLYPAFDLNCVKSVMKNPSVSEKLRLLFISRHFFDDGGRELIKAFKVLAKKYDMTLTIITNPPPHHISKFENFIKSIKNDKIRIIKGFLPRARLFEEYFSNSDIFVLPSYIHFFGFVFLEAMAFGLPLIGTNIYSMPEIIEENVNGFTVTPPISCFDTNLMKPKKHLENYRRYVLLDSYWEAVVDQLIDTISLLAEDETLRRRMGEASRRMVEKGKFSIIERNKKLSKIYQEALN